MDKGNEWIMSLVILFKETWIIMARWCW